MRRRLALFLILLAALLAPVLPPPQRVAAANCTDDAELVEQTLDPAAEVMVAGSSFNVSWTLENSGDCAWSRSYRLIFVDGERMDGSRTLRLRSAVEPGERVTLSLDLSAPRNAGSYSGTWQLRNEDGDNFGPELTASIEVGEGEGGTDVVLPEVLVFGGMGGGGGPEALTYCLDNGELPSEPTLVPDTSQLSTRYLFIYLCSLPEGDTVTVEVSDPAGNTFRRDYVQDAAVTTTDEDGNEYTGTVLQIDLYWLPQAETGDWPITFTGDYEDESRIIVPPPVVPEVYDDGTVYPILDNLPTTPLDPFAMADTCHYNYTPGQAMTINGSLLPPDTILQMGIYQERLGNGYKVDQVTVQTDDDGNLEVPYNASPEAGNYSIYLFQQVSEEGYLDDNTQYDAGGTGDNLAYSCYGVVLEAEPEFPWRLAFESSSSGVTGINVYDFATGYSYYPTINNGVCNNAEPAWWPDGEWVLYQADCLVDFSQGYLDATVDGDYDLFASNLDPDLRMSEEERHVQVTDTPDLNETEPDSNADGVIVYRKTPVDTPLDASGELWLLDITNETDTALDLTGRAPTWSPDGSRIAFTSDVEGTWQIYVYRVEDAKLTLVSEDCATQCRNPAWSPDGKQIIYEASATLDDLTPAALWTASASAAGKPRLYLEGPYGHPTWSAEGWIFFQGPHGLYRAKPGRRAVAERFLYSDPTYGDLLAPQWTY